MISRKTATLGAKAQLFDKILIFFFRHLMDSLRSEEVRRQKSAILKNYGLTEKTDPKTVGQNLKKKLQALGRHSNYTLMDKIFGGQLVSTIVCEACHNSSQIYEPFLDLSLSLIEEKEKRPQSKTKDASIDNEDLESTNVSCFGTTSNKPSKKSKAQQKRAKKLERKAKQNQENNSATEPKIEKEITENEKDVQISNESVASNAPTIKIETHQNRFNALNKTPKVKKVTSTDSTTPINSIKSSNNSKNAKRVIGGSDEDDEDGFSPEEDENWEWDYGEPPEEGKLIKNVNFT